MFGDEASFWLDGTLHRTWARVGEQPRVDTFGERKMAHVFGVLSLERRPLFFYRFAEVFNAKTFLAFLKELVRRCRRRKIFLVVDNGPCHSLDADGKEWLAKNLHRVELFRLPRTRASSTRSRACGRRRRSRPPTTASTERPSSATPRSARRSGRSRPTPA